MKLKNEPIDFSDMSVRKGQAYDRQAKAPRGVGTSGPSQDDGETIKSWDKPTNKGDAYSEQSKWANNDNSNPSLGFKLSGSEAGYLGHFNNEKYLTQGHNDGPNMEMAGVGYSPNGDVMVRNSHSPSQSALLKKGPDEEPNFKRNLEGKEFAKKKVHRTRSEALPRSRRMTTGKLRETDPTTSKRHKADDGNSSGGMSGY